MGLLGAIGFFLALVTLTQTLHIAEGCNIVSASSSSASSILVKWKEYPGTTNYVLDLREKNSPQSAPVIASISGSQTERNIFGLKPGTEYNVTVKAFVFFNVACVNSTLAFTVPDTSQIVEGRALSSTSIKVTWTTVPSAQKYYLEVYSQTTRTTMNFTYTNTTAVIRNLQHSSNYDCYVYTVNQAGLGRGSKVKTITTLVQPPVGITAIQTNQVMARITWEPVNTVLLYHVKIRNLDDPSSQPSSHDVPDTKLDVQGILPCSTYLISVSSYSTFLVASEPTDYTYTTNKLTPVSSVSVDYSCTTNSVTVSWPAASGATSYRAVAVGSNGTQLECTSQSTNCLIKGLSCGQEYTVYVTPISDKCKNLINNTSTTFNTAPCPPANPMLLRDCNSDVIIFSWNQTNEANHYLARAVDSKGMVRECMTQENNCYFTNTYCGRYYSFTVQSVSGSCSSGLSSPVGVRTAPCIPQNLETVADCSVDNLLSKWDNAEGALYYTVAAVGNYRNSSYNCSSVSNSCVMKGVKCGDHLTVTIRSFDNDCPSPTQLGSPAETMPCTPQNISAERNCAKDSISVKWEMSNAAPFYVAMAKDSNGVIHSCNSVDMLCTISGLKCSTSYKVYAIASNFVCNSSESDMFTIETAPCPPNNLTATLDCAANEALISWHGSVNSYTATIIDSSQRLLSCSSTATNCKIPNLKCGERYTVTVSQHDGNCSSMPSTHIYMESVPCGPANASARVDCASGNVTINWNPSQNAERYIVIISNGTMPLTYETTQTNLAVHTLECGQEYTVNLMSFNGSCVSRPSELYFREELSCNLEGLQCGKMYNFTVSASDYYCQSPDSKPVIHTTAPCTVQNMLTTLNCTTNILTISWTPGSMPVNYSTTAVTTNGTTLRCVTQSSRCTMPELQCGQQYSVRVKPISSTCEGPSSVPEIVNSVPCVPLNIQTLVECSTNRVWGSWDAAPGAMYYISTLKGAGGFSTSCQTANQRCLFSGLQCAQTYMFSVMASNNRCNSSNSAMDTATTAPCDPTNVSASLNCLSDVVTVTWRASAGANYYTILAEASGHVSSCNSTGTSCELRNMQCGNDYTVTVLAGDTKCNSSIFAKTNITTAPCAPVIQDHSLNCSSNQALVTWVKDEDAMTVMVNATSSMGYLQSCSSSSNNSCVLDLLCGNTYTVKAVAKGPQCLSKPSSAFQIVTAPCTPANVEYQYSCDTGIAFVSWDETLGRKRFYVHAESGNFTASCSTSQTDCSLPTLLCSRTYSVKVVALADSCNSSVPGVTTIQTAPCAPVNISASLLCDNNTAAVSWQHSLSAVSYSVKAVGRDGDLKRCATNSTSCLLPNMHCSQTYIITVTPFSMRCEGRESFPYTYNAGSCPPTNVHMSLQCDGNVSHVTWDPALRADLYLATTAPSLTDKHIHNCSSNGTSCSLTDLPCGETVVVTVVTIERGCTSQPSVPFTLETVICPPTGVTGVTNCRNNDITVSWDPSPESGVTYFIYSQGNSGIAYNYSTTQTFYVMNGLQCGQTYMLSVAAQDPDCTSLLSKQIETETVPCPPTNLTVKTQCATNLAILKWAPSTHAISYTATLTGTHGHLVSCRTNKTTCSLHVDCAKQYSAFVVASSATCNSSKSDNLTFVSAPCLPDRVQAELDCNANTFAVEWRGSLGDIDYTAIAIGRDKTRRTCNSSSTNCVIQDLTCGLIYSIVVTTSSIDCGLIEGSNYEIQSAPCKPNSVMVNLQCITNMATVSWANSGPDQMQVVSARDSRGTVTTCNSTSSNCTFSQLKCGEIYGISVVGLTSNCSSEPAFAQRLNMAPCIPTHVTARVDCNTGITAVTWDAALGATSYTVYARGSLGYNAQCNNTDTNCDFLNLACGQDYNITVVARHNTCVSIASETVKATTGPCPHSGLRTSLDCNTNTAVVSWTTGIGILYYNATAEAFGSIDKQTCSTNGSSCNISSLQCGESYKVSVSGQGLDCSSPAQDWHRVNTAPCPPTQLMVNSSCKSNNISVSWQASQGSVSYMAVAENEQGHRWSCNTSSTSCQISGLLCGQQYNVYVVGIDDKCTGAKSDMKKIRTAPCVPQNIQNRLDCLSGVLNITWQSTGYFLNFRASVVNSEGQMSVCTTPMHYCVVQNMQCGQTYNVTVVAQDEACNSSHSPTEQVSTAPCPPSSFLSNVNCGNGVVSVTWNNSVAGVMYTVSAADAKGARHNCSSTNNGCNLSTLACGMQYNVTITPSRNECVGKDSQTKMVKAVPCVPQLSDVEIDCLTNSAWVMYNESAGAKEYVVVATDTTGDVQTFDCNSTSDGMCTLPPLTCSQNFTITLKAKDQQCTSAPSNSVKTETVHVTAEGRTCNSSESEQLMFRTVPCVPENLKASLSCSNNVAYMSWSSIKGGQLFSVKAVGTDGHVDECRVPDNECELTNLHCGQYYTATVSAEDMTCMSKPSENVTIKTVPCTPANVSSVVDCQANSLIVSWSKSSGADSYIATLHDSTNQGTTCQATTEGSCNVTGLGCGQIYHVSVVSSDGYCNSPPTPVVDTPSVPCNAINIRAYMDCEIKTAVVSWWPSDGALSYIAMATTNSGHNVTCETNRTSCDLTELLCGQSYSVSVKAIGKTCSSIAKMTGQLVTEPCIPIQITTQYSVTIGQVQWDMSNGANYYTVTGQTDQGLTTTSCVTNDTYCALYNMYCGQKYSIVVTANNFVCQNVSASTVLIVTEPCPPNNVQTNVNCQDNQGMVSWETSFGAVGYEASFAGRDGHSLSCHTNATSCSVEGLHCGVVYHTDVIAIGEKLNSIRSNTVLLYSAPCAVGKCTANLDCYNDTATVSWSPVSGANSYMVTAVSADGSRASCESTEHQCNLTELECGQVYNVTLVTISNHCRTEKSTNISFSTRPCKPSRVGVDLQCGTSTANMYWEESAGVELYMATATNMGTTLKCNSTNSTCQFSNLTCGDTYKLSVIAYSNRCYSEISSTVEIQTEPCKPDGLRVHGSCNNETVLLYWFKAKGASKYIVTADGNLGYSTSLQTNNTMIETNLPCGQLFTFTVKAQDDWCDSPTSRPEKYMTTPCVPAHVQSFTRCEKSLGSVSWAASDGAESYMAIATGQDRHVHTCTTNTTICTWNDLHCGETYTVYVVAMNYVCTSMPSNSTSIRMAPCIPQNLTSSFNCTTKVGSLAWSASETAEFYIVTAENNIGHKVQLSTNDTWTYISEFHCGQEYFLSVQAADSVCTSRPSPPLNLTSEPCSPTGISSFMNCISNIAVVSWTGSAGAEYYIANVRTEDGQSSSCWSDSEQCAMPNVLCGQNYAVTVVASNRKCNSDPSKGDPLRSVPCVPTNVEVEMVCSKNQAVVSWSASNGALSYKVTAQSTLGSMSICQTAGLRCTLTNLTCGHDYSVQVVAEGGTCSSLPSPAITFHSVPCTPNIGTVILDCFTNSALLDWAYAEGALYYNATAQSSSGHVSTCSSNITNCELPGLQCGQIYDVITVASNYECRSPPSSTLQVESVPCPPEDVVHVLDCSTNTAVVEWQASRGADYYIVQAVGVQEDETSCETMSQSCILADLLCGFTYNISVIAVNDVCNVSMSDTQQMQAVPCIPQLVEARVVCESGAVAVSWEPSKEALSYTVVAQGHGGYASVCNSNDSTCLLGDVLCGLNYSITVTASDDTCNSNESSAVEIDTVPCVPQKVRAEMECRNDTGVVSWEEEEGVSIYLVQAFGPDGHKSECDTTESSCELPNMHCGQLYNLTVTAQDGRCDNSQAHLSLQSVPCKPTSVKASLRCHSNSAAVTWEGASGALLYTAVGVTADGRYRAECNNTMTFCDLSELQCGQTYSVSVFSQDDSCSSLEGNKAYVRTAPCPPQNVVVGAQCGAGSMVVSWSPNPDAQYFHVAAVSNTGARLYCNSTGNSCTLNNLPCGQSYNITVLSIRDGCQSKPSAVVESSSAPCIPRNIKGSLDCISNSAWVTWDDSMGATSYSVLARAANGHNSSCTTTSSPCKVQDLNCGTLYTFKLKAINKHCSSIDNATFELETGPCTLTSVSAMSQCNSDTILVEWKVTAGTPVYVVTAEGDDNSVVTCNSTSTSCVLQNVHCGMHYSVIVATSSDKCSSLRSPPKKIQTAPCVPANVTVVPSCKDAGAKVRWADSLVPTSYQLIATTRDGHVATCNTSLNNCSLVDLHCGQLYNLSITARGENCTSYPISSSFKTVPCAPSDIAVDIDCQTNSAAMSWNKSTGAVEYFSFAQSTNGVALSCNSSNPSCTFKGLECGGVYNFSVTASNSICNSSFSSPLQAGAVPCPPSRVNVRMQRIDRLYWAMISWSKVTCPDVEYLAEISGQIENNPQALMTVSSYWLPRPYFEFPVPCSTAFNITVRAKNSAGIGKPSSPITALTAPCAPQSVMYAGNRQSAVLFWNASVFATSYTVYNVSRGTRVKLCNTTELSCQLTDFDPNATIVTASNAVGESNPSQNITGPVTTRRRRDLVQFYEDLEIPEVLTLTVSGVSLHVSWTTVTGATEYTLMIEEEQIDGKASKPARVRRVEGDSYTETDLKPQTTYCVRVAAKNAINQSSYSQSKCRNTDALVGS
ncbi:uncharacterized protein LOC102776891 [Neolamprologus brichardi]|uniref:uncharacterized protein LOC102776891 n=1 Tax=Neolamprologus brichardi TaxID=32507 RepID=UPI001643E43A|nr:uncharacterized protein LOC102776891 [Neolamprologus brichardi]